MSHEQYSKRLTPGTSQDYSFERMGELKVWDIVDTFNIPFISSTRKTIPSKVSLDFTNYEIFAIKSKNTTTRNIMLMQNNFDPDQVIIGVSGTQNDEINTIRMQALFSVHKSSFSLEHAHRDFFIKDDNAT